MSEAAAEPSAPKKKGNKLVLIIALGVVLAAGGAGGTWFFLQQGKPADAKAAQAKKAALKPIFTTLEPFTVNLQDPRGERFAQVGITLQIDDPDVEMKVKDHLPAVRNDILMLISSKQIDDLLSMEGKQQLAQQIRHRTARAIGVELPEPGTPAGKTPPPENPIREVLFSQFIVQ